eukprot:1160148-Pelagomonas_calceolata.AAC.3
MMPNSLLPPSPPPPPPPPPPLPPHTMCYAAGAASYTGPTYLSALDDPTNRVPGQQLETARRQHADLLDSVQEYKWKICHLGPGAGCFQYPSRSPLALSVFSFVVDGTHSSSELMSPLPSLMWKEFSLPK